MIIINRLAALRKSLLDYRKEIEYNQELDGMDKAIVLLLEMHIEDELKNNNTLLTGKKPFMMIVDEYVGNIEYDVSRETYNEKLLKENQRLKIQLSAMTLLCNAQQKELNEVANER